MTSDVPVPFGVSNGRLLFRADSPGIGATLPTVHRASGDVRRLVSAEVSDPQLGIEYAGQVYVEAVNAAGLRKIFAYDGLSDRIAQVTTTAGDAADDTFDPHIRYASKLMFVSPNVFGARKIFSICDTTSGCVP